MIVKINLKEDIIFLDIDRPYEIERCLCGHCNGAVFIKQEKLQYLNQYNEIKEIAARYLPLYTEETLKTLIKNLIFQEKFLENICTSK